MGGQIFTLDISVRFSRTWTLPRRDCEMSSRNSIDMITDKNALSIGESIGWKKLVGQVELPKLSCELSGSKGREHSEDYIP